MMGWRQGYIAYPEEAGGGRGGSLVAELLKVQDTIPVCPTQIRCGAVRWVGVWLGGEGSVLARFGLTVCALSSANYPHAAPLRPNDLHAPRSQYVALGATQAGRGWVEERVSGLESNRAALLDALSPLGAGSVVGGEGAIYLFARLPPGCEDDEAVVQWLVRRHRVCLIPGTACGCPGHVRAAYANLRPELCAEAAARLKAGLADLVQHGMPAVRAFLAAEQAAAVAV